VKVCTWYKTYISTQQPDVFYDNTSFELPCGILTVICPQISIDDLLVCFPVVQLNTTAYLHRQNTVSINWYGWLGSNICSIDFNKFGDNSTLKFLSTKNGNVVETHIQVSSMCRHSLHYTHIAAYAKVVLFMHESKSWLKFKSWRSDCIASQYWPTELTYRQHCSIDNFPLTHKH